jgi:hypothetical protein
MTGVDFEGMSVDRREFTLNGKIAAANGMPQNHTNGFQTS